MTVSVLWGLFNVLVLWHDLNEVWFFLFIALLKLNLFIDLFLILFRLGLSLSNLLVNTFLGRAIVGFKSVNVFLIDLPWIVVLLTLLFLHGWLIRIWDDLIRLIWITYWNVVASFLLLRNFFVVFEVFTKSVYLNWFLKWLWFLSSRHWVCVIVKLLLRLNQFLMVVLKLLLVHIGLRCLLVLLRVPSWMIEMFWILFHYSIPLFTSLTKVLVGFIVVPAAELKVVVSGVFGLLLPLPHITLLVLVALTLSLDGVIRIHHWVLLLVLIVVVISPSTRVLLLVSMSSTVSPVLIPPPATVPLSSIVLLLIEVLSVSFTFCKQMKWLVIK